MRVSRSFYAVEKSGFPDKLGSPRFSYSKQIGVCAGTMQNKIVSYHAIDQQPI